MNTATQRIGPDKLRALLPKLDSEVFSKEVFDLTGIFIIRKAIPADTMRLWQAEWEKFYNSELSAGRNVNKFNPVSLNETLPPMLAAIHQDPALLDVIEQAFGPDIGLYNQRFVIKDKHSRGSIFLHQDYCYHLGWPTKASAFVALSPASPENGGLVFYLGTHQFGYLGDAGEINPEILDPDWPTVAPSLVPGDVALMNSLTWHRSGPHVSGPDRIVADIIYQPANDPSSVALLRGQWRTEIFLNSKHPKRDKLFTRSRTSKLAEMGNRLDELEAKAKAAG